MYKKLFIIMTIIGIGMSSCNTEKEPEVLSDNPFFNEYTTPYGVPPFDLIKAEHYMPAFEKGMEEQKAEVEKIINNTKKPTFKNTIRALDNTGKLLTKVTTVFFGLSGANTNDDLQKIQLEVSPLLAAHGDAINLNPKLFERVKAIYDKKDKLKLTEEEAYILENTYKGFVRSGTLLPPDEQEIMKKLNLEQSVVGVNFGQNVLSETNSFMLVVDNEDDLKGLPESSVVAAAKTASAAGLDGKWAFTAQKPSWIPFLQFAENRKLREDVYAGWLLRCRTDNEYNNEDNLAKIMSLRAQKATLLGYPTHADMVMESRMAKKASNVFDLLDQVWEPALKAAIRDRDEMQTMIDNEGGDFKLAAHDWWYYTEKLRKAKYDLDESELRPYFKLENVRDGAFDVANKLYGITFEELFDMPRPHPDVMVFEVFDTDGKHLGILYQDYYPRQSKRQGAWCGAYRGHKWEKRKEIHPVVTMVCNFTPPSGDSPALISTEEASTLFHEFGHALDVLFAENTLSASYRARDFVELPSQIMEHWAAEPEVMKTYALHYETNEPIPDYLIEKMQKSSVFNQGFTSTEFLAACYLDMAYHTITQAEPVDIPSFEKELLDKIGLIPEIEPRYHSTYFTHIIGGYDAGYYSYEWSAVLDHDAFDAFKETSLFDQETAKSFRDNILAKNGFADPAEMFEKFRGRKPDITALMRNRGFIE
ncbi:MAG: M3 family metallopeptidase [Bacteroidetes bacterium]|jgi:peptidyl-dipeptidase Dcp|nr:M3 family metallopeptidase [Bacteroidota bacterium]MBT4398645.1 M3 family metallopeptidase [Bacteroidota bacterium]MBT4409846.1 M3 family metallopeptidase [Bacteroidota bacterium]MBT5425965.1 M3 family metallopeptidase [Bacteroidota bacterium]MBT7093316.1 M3 family metallopeptidase [Bacteroidota bacterium]